MRLPAIVLLGTALATTTVAAQERVDRTFGTRAGTVEIQNVAGSVRVTGWDRDEVRVTGTLGEGTERLEIDEARGLIRVVLPRNARNVKGSDLEVRVPAGRGLNVRTVSADIGVEGMGGAVNARSTSGDVEISGTPRQVTAASTSGDVDVEVTTGRVQVSSTSGDVTVGGTVREAVSVESVSGDVNVTARTPEVRAKAVSGDVALRGVSGRVSAGTVSGDAEIVDSRIQYGSFETVSGNLRYEGELMRGVAFDIKSHSGDVELILPAGVDAEFEAKTFSGDIRSDFGGEVRRTSRYTPNKELRVTAGSGGGLVTVQTFSGTVTLSRR